MIRFVVVNDDSEPRTRDDLGLQIAFHLLHFLTNHVAKYVFIFPLAFLNLSILSN